MKILQRIVSKQTLGSDVLRLVLCAILFTHGANRLYRGEARVLGEIITEQGFPAGLLTAYLICLAETLGTLLLALRLLVLPVTLSLAFIYAMGIYLFNRHNGFFVVGAGEGGWEYNALIIACLFAIAWENRKHLLY